MIAVVLSMVLLLTGAAGNTKETGNEAFSYESIENEETKVCLAMNVIAELGTIHIDEKDKEEELTIEEEPKAEETGGGEEDISPQEEAEGGKETEARTVQEEMRETEEAVAEETPEMPPQEMPEQPVPQENPQTEEAAKSPAVAENSSQWIISISDEDYDALLRIVECEASGQDIKGRMLVANVVLNRLNRGNFGGSVKEVIYQRSANGKAQFSPVSTGKINRITVTPETVEAVNRALCGEDESQGALYFASRAHASPESMAWFDNHLTWLFAYGGHEFFM